MPEHNENPKHKAADMHRKASEFLRKAAQHNELAATHLNNEKTELARDAALTAYALQLEATHQLNEAIKHQTGIMPPKKDHHKEPHKEPHKDHPKEQNNEPLKPVANEA